MTRYLKSFLEGCEHSLQLCKDAARRPDIPFEEHYQELVTMEKAYHYAQRYLTCFAGPKAKQRQSVELAFEVLLEAAREGFIGLIYSTRQKRYRRLRERGPGSAQGFDTIMTWDQNPWMLVQAADRLASAIRRVKAVTVNDVYAKLFI